MNKKKIKLYSNIIPVKGFIKSCLVDLQNNSIESIPNILFDILTYSCKSVSEIKEIHNNTYNVGIDNYFSLLKEKGMVFTTEFPERFQIMSLQWHSPSIITNAVIDLNNDKDFSIIIENYCQFESLFVKAIHIRFSYSPDIVLLKNFYNSVKDSIVSSIYLSIHISNDSYVDILKISLECIRVKKISFYNVPKNTNHKLHGSFRLKPLFYHYGIDFKDCGYVNKYFTPNIYHFTESQCHNTCLNRKISVDSDGYIKNCPSMKQHYGHISVTTLEEAIEKEGFKDLWFICKDDIDVCQDCEFRHMCTDCRAFIKDSENIYSQPEKCNYNPYMAIWEGQEGWISIEQWRAENPDWEEKAKANRATFDTEDCSQYHK